MSSETTPYRKSAYFSSNEMKLGVLCMNISGGMMMSSAAKNKLDWNERCGGKAGLIYSRLGLDGKEGT